MSELVPARKLSKAMFSREHRLTVYNAILGKCVEPPEPFRGKDIFDELQPEVLATQIGQDINVLVELGAVVRVPELDVFPSTYYCRVDSAMWPFVQELAERTIELSSVTVIEE